MTEKKTFFLQLKENEVGIISLIVAIVALFTSLWLYEKSETNRNIRIASFEVLMQLGQLQQVVNTIHYQKENSFDTLSLGWGHVALIGDLSSLIPTPVPESTQKLIVAWKQNLDSIRDNEDSAAKISEEIDSTRKEILHVLATLR